MQITKEDNTSLYDFLDRQIAMFKGYFMVTRASLDKESIHQMRVTVKRINTFYKLKKHIRFPVTIPDGLFEIIKQTYSASGRLRDLHIQKKLLAEYRKKLDNDFPELKKYLANTEKSLKQELHQITENINPELLNDASSSSRPPADINGVAGLEDESAAFLNKKVDKINKLLLHINDENHVHDLRKQIKQVYFVLQFLGDYFPKSKYAGYRLKPLRRITDRLGHWNDLTMFTMRIGDFIQTSDHEHNSDYYLLSKVIEAEKKEMLKDIDARIYLQLLLLQKLQNGDKPIGFKN